MDLNDLRVMHEQNRMASERHGKVVALGSVADFITGYIEGRDSISIEERQALADVTAWILHSLKELSTDRALARDMALCAANHAKEAEPEEYIPFEDKP